MIQSKKCLKPNIPCQYIRETKRKLNERFGEHRRSVENPHHLSCPTLISEYFNLPAHSTKDMQIIPLIFIHRSRDSVRKAREAFLIDKVNTLEPLRINRRDERYSLSTLVSSVYHLSNSSSIIFIVFEFHNLFFKKNFLYNVFTQL